jgi:hypothetical protein
VGTLVDYIKEPSSARLPNIMALGTSLFRGTLALSVISKGPRAARI